MEVSDSLLLDGVRQGNEKAFDELYRRYARQVYRALLRLTGEESEAEDLTQETFLKLFRRPPANGHDPNVGAWLYRVALNLGYNTLRGGRRRGEREERALRALPASGGALDPAGVAARREERDLVRSVLRGLPANYQAVLILRHEGLSYAEIASVVGIGISAVGTVLARAEKQFKARYLQVADGPGRDAHAMP